MASSSHVQQRLVLDVPREHLHELRIDARPPYRERMADDPHHQTRNPQLQAQSHGGGQRAVGNGDRARRTAQQDGFGQRTMQRSEEHTSELQSLMRISYAVFCLKKKKNINTHTQEESQNTHKR